MLTLKIKTIYKNKKNKKGNNKKNKIYIVYKNNVSMSALLKKYLLEIPTANILHADITSA